MRKCKAKVSLPTDDVMTKTPEESLKSLRRAVKIVGATQDKHFYLTLPYYVVGRWLRLVERGAEFKVGGSNYDPIVVWDLHDKEN